MAFLNKKPHAGININDRSIELIVVDDTVHPKRIAHAGRTTLPEGAIVRGQIHQKEKVVRALKSVRAKAGIAERQQLRATVSLSEELVFPFAVTFETALPQAQKHIHIQEEAKKRVPLPEKSISLFTLEEHPSGTTTFVYAIQTDIATVYEDVLQQVHTEVDHIEPESVAVGRFLLPDNHKRQTTTVIDIGTNISHIITYHEGYPILSQSVPFGGETLGTKKKTPKSKRPYKFFIDELKERIALAEEYGARYRHTQEDHVLVLVGGGALLSHISEEIEKTIKQKTRIGSLGQPLDIPRSIKRELPLYTQAVGSALRESSKVAHLNLTPIEKVPEVLRKQTASLSVFKSRTTLLVVFFILLIILLISLLVVRNNNSSAVPPEFVNSLPQNQNSEAPTTTTSLKILTIKMTPDDTSLPYSVLEKDATQTTTVETSGIIETESESRGIATFINTTNVEKTLVKSTRIQSPDGLIFRTQEDITIPANGELLTLVVAETPGESGNIAAGTRFTVPGLSTFNQQVIYAENKEAFTGGVTNKKTVSASDVRTAEKTLQEKILSELESLFAATTSNTTTVFFVEDATTFVSSADPEIGQESETVAITTKARGVAAQVLKSDLLETLKAQGATINSLDNVEVTSASYNPDEQSFDFSITVTSSS